MLQNANTFAFCLFCSLLGDQQAYKAQVCFQDCDILNLQ